MYINIDREYTREGVGAKGTRNLPMAATVLVPPSLDIHQTSPMSNPRPAHAT